MHDDTDTPQRIRPLAMLLAWIWPGLGHISLGERVRGFRIMGGMLLLFFGGLLIGGVDSVDRREDTLWFLPQAACGPIAFAADLANTALLKSAPPDQLLSPPEPSGSGRLLPPTVSKRRGLAHPNEFGTLFIALAGLMNVAVILDAGFRRGGHAAPALGGAA